MVLALATAPRTVSFDPAAFSSSSSYLFSSFSSASPTASYWIEPGFNFVGLLQIDTNTHSRLAFIRRWIGVNTLLLSARIQGLFFHINLFIISLSSRSIILIDFVSSSIPFFPSLLFPFFPSLLPSLFSICPHSFLLIPTVFFVLFLFFVCMFVFFVLSLSALFHSFLQMSRILSFTTVWRAIIGCGCLTS